MMIFIVTAVRCLDLTEILYLVYFSVYQNLSTSWDNWLFFHSMWTNTEKFYPCNNHVTYLPFIYLLQSEEHRRISPSSDMERLRRPSKLVRTEQEALLSDICKTTRVCSHLLLCPKIKFSEVSEL